MSQGALLRALAEDEPLIEDVALAIASDAYPTLELARCRGELDALAAPIRESCARAETHWQRLALLNERLFGECGFRGNERDYHDPRNSYLNDVLERRLGIPISLAAVMMAVGRRVGLPVEGIGFPGHFLVRVGGEHGPIVDPFHEGRLLSHEDLRDLAARVHSGGGPGEGAGGAGTLRAYLRPVDARAMAIRMLSNLLAVFERAGDHARALLVCDRLVDVGGRPHHRRDRGRHAFALGAMRSARVDLAAYLRAEPDAADADAIEAMIRRATANEHPLH